MRLHLFGINKALLAGAGVGAAAVDSDSLRIAMRVHLTAHEYRSRTHFILRKHCAAGSWSSAIDNCNIVVTARLQTSLDAGSEEALRCSHPAFYFFHENPSFRLRFSAKSRSVTS